MYGRHNDMNYLNQLHSKKNNLKYRYRNNPCQSTLFDILNILKEINSLKAKIDRE